MATQAPPTERYPALLADLRRVDRRLRSQEAVQGTPLAVAGALGLATGLALAGRITPLLPPEQVAGVAAILVLLAVAGWAGVAFVRRRTRLALARRADRVLNLSEKVATAVDLHDKPRRAGISPALQAAQLVDATDSLAAALPTLPDRVPL